MIHIVFAPDDNYVMQTVVAMTSLLENTRDEVTIHVLYLENHLTKENILKLQSTVCLYNAQFEEVPVNESLIKGFPILRHGPAAYLRILAPYVLPDINKILYIDGDVIVDKSIAELYDIDVSKYEFEQISTFACTIWLRHYLMPEPFTFLIIFIIYLNITNYIYLIYYFI